ncbi:MAG: response regulator [Legionellales bacterium]|nr:response regulator [Legionellales bacterium]
MSGALNTNLPLEILLVEDNEGDVEMTRWALKNSQPPCHLHVVNDGAEALDFLYKNGDFANAITPDLIFLDMNMPRMKGKELLSKIKADPQLKSIPAIVLTSSQAPADILESYEHYASGYIVKPFDSQEYQNTLKQMVSFWGALVVLPHGNHLM